MSKISDVVAASNYEEHNNELARVYFNAYPKDKFVRSTLRFYLDDANAFVNKLPKGKGLESFRRRCADAAAKLQKFYNKHASFAMFIHHHRRGNDISCALSLMYSSEFGYLYVAPHAALDNVFVCSHALDRYEERAKPFQTVLDPRPGEQIVFTTATALDRIGDAIREFVYLNEVEYAYVNKTLFSIKLGDHGVIGIESRGDGEVFLLKTFMSPDMNNHTDSEWRQCRPQPSFLNLLRHIVKEANALYPRQDQ